MIDDTVWQRLETLAAAARIDEFALNTEASRIGSELDGLRELVERYAGSTNKVLVRAVAFSLAWAPREMERPDDELNNVVLQFIDATRSTDDPGTLSMSATAVQGLNARGLLAARATEDKAVLGAFLLRCLEHEDPNVRGAALQLMGHLFADGRLSQVLSQPFAATLRARLIQLAAEVGAEHSDELAALRDFWARPSLGA